MEHGYDGIKRLARRKRHPLLDTGGLVLGARVHAASLHVRDGGRELLKRRVQAGAAHVGHRTGGRVVHREMGGSEPIGAK